MRLSISASIDVGVPRSARFAALAGLATAALVVVAALGGIALPAMYARENPLWRTEGLGQDWASLLVDVPWLVVSALLVLRGSRRARFLLGGALAYTGYTYAVYAFDVHFNALFLVYCGALGTSAFALCALASDLRDAATWFGANVPRRFAGGFAMACAFAFALLWLSQIIPALLQGSSPTDVEACGLMTNPVHVLDLALALPALFAGGWLLWNDRPLGYAVVPVMLGFLVLMGAALVGMTIAMVVERVAPSSALVALFAGFVALGVAALVWMLLAMTRPGGGHAMARIVAS
jgi:hypothetical protein